MLDLAAAYPASDFKTLALSGILLQYRVWTLLVRNIMPPYRTRGNPAEGKTSLHR